MNTMITIEFDLQEKTLDEKFRKYHEENPEIYSSLVELARHAKCKGHRKLGMKMLFEVVRWQRILQAEDPEGFKINNNFHSRYARLIMEVEPDLQGIFDLRKLRS